MSIPLVCWCVDKPGWVGGGVNGGGVEVVGVDMMSEERFFNMLYCGPHQMLSCFLCSTTTVQSAGRTGWLCCCLLSMNQVVKRRASREALWVSSITTTTEACRKGGDCARILRTTYRWRRVVCPAPAFDCDQSSSLPATFFSLLLFFRFDPHHHQ
jgi:hypothetical protein